MLLHHFGSWLSGSATVWPGWPQFPITGLAAPAFFIAAGASSALFLQSRRRHGFTMLRVGGQLLRRYGLLIPIGMVMRWALWQDPFGVGVFEALGITVVLCAAVVALLPDRALPAATVAAFSLGIAAERSADGHHDWVSAELLAGKFPLMTYLGFVLVGALVARSGRLTDRRWVATMTLLSLAGMGLLLADGVIPDRYPGDVPFVVPALAGTGLIYLVAQMDWPAWLEPFDRLLRQAAAHTFGIFMAHYVVFYGLREGGVNGTVDPRSAIVSAIAVTVAMCVAAPLVPQLPWSPRTGWRRRTRPSPQPVRVYS